MIARLPLYVALPEDQDWTFGEIDGEQVILINEALDDEGRREARKAAYASLRKGFPAWVSLPLITAGSWLSDRVRTPFGSAVTASVLTAVAVYGVTTPNGQPRPIADPPSVVTLHPTVESTVLATPLPTMAGTRTSSPPATHRPARTRPAAQPDRSSEPAPTRSAISPRRRDDGRPAPHPSPTSAPPTAAATPTTQAPAPEAALEPPAAGIRLQATPGDGAAGDLSVLDSPGSLGADTACGGIHVGATLDPVLGLDLCLLD